MPLTVINADTGINQIQKNTMVASGGGSDYVFHLNNISVTTSYTIPIGKNALTAGPVTIADGVTVTVSDGSTWVVV